MQDCARVADVTERTVEGQVDGEWLRARLRLVVERLVMHGLALKRAHNRILLGKVVCHGRVVTAAVVAAPRHRCRLPRQAKDMHRPARGNEQSQTSDSSEGVPVVLGWMAGELCALAELQGSDDGHKACGGDGRRKLSHEKPSEPVYLAVSLR